MPCCGPGQRTASAQLLAQLSFGSGPASEVPFFRKHTNQETVLAIIALAKPLRLFRSNAVTAGG